MRSTNTSASYSNPTETGNGSNYLKTELRNCGGREGIKELLSWMQPNLCWTPSRNQSITDQTGLSDLQIERRLFKKRKMNLKVDNMLQIKRYFVPKVFSTG